MDLEDNDFLAIGDNRNVKSRSKNNNNKRNNKRETMERDEQKQKRNE